MSLNDITLTPHLLTALYPNTLIEEKNPSTSEIFAAKSVPENPAASAIRFLGKNEKSILIVVKNERLPFLGDEELSLLTSILSACSLSLADVAIINWVNVSDKNLQDLFSQLSGNQVLLFGLTPAEFGLPIDFPCFQVQPFAERTYVYAPDLTALKSDKEQKKQLWSALKKLFAI